MSSYSNPLSAFDELDIVNQEQSVEPNYISNLLGDTSGDLTSTNQTLAQAGIEPALSSGRITTPSTSFGDAAQTATQQLDPYALISPAGTFNLSPSGQATTTTPFSSTTAQANATPGTGILAQIETWFQSKEAGWVAIVVGVVLIAGAVFGFKNIANTVIETGKGAVKEGGKVAVAGAAAA